MDVVYLLIIFDILFSCYDSVCHVIFPVREPIPPVTKCPLETISTNLKVKRRKKLDDLINEVRTRGTEVVKKRYPVQVLGKTVRLLP